MGCKPTYKGVRYNSVDELIAANKNLSEAEVNKIVEQEGFTIAAEQSEYAATIDDSYVTEQLENATAEQTRTVESLVARQARVTMPNDANENYVIINSDGTGVFEATRTSHHMDEIPEFKFDKENFDPSEYEANREWGNQADFILTKLIAYGVQQKDKVVSEFLQTYQEDKSLFTPEALEQVTEFFIDYINKHREQGNILLSQVTFWNQETGHAGTEDVVIVAPDGSIVFNDLKTSIYPVSKPYQKLGADGQTYTNSYDRGFEANGVKKASKKRRHQYAQSMYKAMATAAGYKVSKLEILPLLVEVNDAKQITKVTLEPIQRLDTLADVMEEFGTDSYATPEVFSKYRSQFAKILEKIKKDLEKEKKNANSKLDKAKIALIIKEIDENKDAMESISNLVDDAYTLLRGGKKTLPDGRSINIKSFFQLFSEIDAENPQEAIQRILEFKDRLNIYAPMMKQISTLYSEILYQEFGSTDNIPGDTIMSKLDDVAKDINRLDKLIAEELNPLYAKVLYKMHAGKDESDPAIQQQIVYYDRRMARAKDEAAKKKVQAEKDAYMKQMLLSEQDVLDFLNEGGIEDINLMDANILPAVMSGSPLVALFVKKLKAELEIKRQKVLKEARKAAKVLEDTVGTSFNPREQYKGLYKKMKMYVDMDENNTPIYEDRLTFLNPYNWGAFNTALEAKMLELSRKYPDYKTDKAVAKSRNIELTAWYNANTVSPSKQDVQINGVSIIQGTDSILAEIEAEVQNGTMSRSMADNKINSLFDDNGNIKADNVWARYFRLPADNYLDNDYKALSGKKKALYDYLITTYMSSQKTMGLDRRTADSFLLPFMPKNATDQFGAYMKDMGVVKGMQATATRWAKDKVGMEEDRDYTYFKEQQKVIPQMYSNPIPITDVSEDLLSSVLLFYKAAEVYEVQSNMQKFSEGYHDIVEGVPMIRRNLTGEVLESKVKFRDVKGDTNTAKILREYIDRVIYGETTDTENPRLKKIASAVTSFVAFTGLGGPMGIIANVGNWAQGTVMTHIEAVGGQVYGQKSWAKGEARVMKYMYMSKDMLNDKINPVSKSKFGQLIDAYDAVQGEFYNEFGRQISQAGLKKFMDSNVWFAAQHMGELQIQYTALAALLDSTTVKTKQGETITLEQAYVLDQNGELAFRDDVDTSSLGTMAGVVPLQLQSKLHFVNKDMHGVYNTLDQAAIKKTWWGTLLLFYRNWYPSGMKRRYKRGSYSEEAGMWTEGMYRTFFKHLLYEVEVMARAGFGFSDKDNKLYTAAQKANMRKTATEIAYLAVTSLMVTILVKLAQAADDDEKYKLLQLAVLTNRVKLELSQFQDPVDMLKLVSTPTLTLNTILNVIRIFQSFGGDIENLIWEGDIQRYQNKYGFFDKGDSKTWAQFLRTFNVTSSRAIWTPEEVLKAQELRGR